MILNKISTIEKQYKNRQKIKNHQKITEHKYAGHKICFSMDKVKIKIWQLYYKDYKYQFWERT